MAGGNKAIIVGRLGNDPEIRTMPNGDPVARISVATSEEWTDKQTGEKSNSYKFCTNCVKYRAIIIQLRTLFLLISNNYVVFSL